MTNRVIANITNLLNSLIKLLQDIIIKYIFQEIFIDILILYATE